MAVFTPIPKARVRTATTVNPGDLRSVREARRKSRQHVSTKDSQPPERTTSFVISRFPRSQRTARSASLRLIPCFTFSSVALSRYEPSSSFNSRSTCSFRNNDRRPVVMFRKKDMRRLLLVTQGHQGIDACSASAGDIAGEQSDGDQQECDDHEGGGISCADTVKHRAKVTRHADGGSDANQGADHSEDESLA